jgi:hypothetical protein
MEEQCLGSLTLEYEEGAPVFVCERCGGRDETWKKFYTEYLKLYTVEEHWKEPKHQISCILGLFCSEYLKKYNTNYLFVPRNPNPYSAKECRDANLMLATFGKNGLEVRTYIIWAFKFGLGSNAQITSIAYLNAPGLIRKFKLWLEKRKTPTRSTQLPKEFLDWCKIEVPELFTKYTLETINDLGAVLNYARTYSAESQIELKAIQQATTLGLIKDDKLNAGRYNEQLDR